MKKLKIFWTRIVNIGVKDNIPSVEKRKIRLLNAIFIVTEFVGFLLIIRGMLQGLKEEAIFQFIGNIGFFIPIFLHYKHKYTSARVFAVIFTTLFLSAMTIYWGNDRGSHIIIFSTSLLSILLFEKKNYIYSLYIYCVVILFFAEITTWYVEPFYTSDNRIAYLRNILITFLMLYIVITFFKSENQRHIRTIDNRNRIITESITYAKRIQETILNKRENISRLFPNSFILFKPRDIVSGDFYWYSQVDNLKIVIAADCTGHGVPGAFMTIMGNAFLNEIINDHKITKPDEILYTLDEKVIESLNQGNEGMDLAILTFDEEKEIVHFAGAKSPVYFVREKKINKIKGSIFPVGSMQYKKKIFESHSFPVKKGDTFYLNSDGFQDQFGMNDKRYMSKNYRLFLEKKSNLEINDQKNQIEEELLKWKGDQPQTDDILIIGIKI